MAANALALPKQIPELGGLRAIAILTVLFYHVFFGWKQSPEAWSGIPRIAIGLIERGWSGVDLFFVLSGFLITGILLDSKSRANYFRNFYARRALRILPVYYTVITLAWILYAAHPGYFALSYAFLANFAPAFGIDLPHGPGVFWSLAVEEHFYLAWPLLVWRTNARSLAGVAAAIVVVSPLARAYFTFLGMNPEVEIYLFTPFRLDGLATGALLALWVRTPNCSRRSTLALAGAAFTAFAVLTLVGVPFGIKDSATLVGASLRFTQFNLFFASVVLAALALHGSAVTAPLRWWIPQRTAELSYCMYLIHVMVGDLYFSTLRSIGWDPVARLGPAPAFWMQMAVLVGATYGLAALSKRYLEDPFLRLKSRFP